MLKYLFPFTIYSCRLFGDLRKNVRRPPFFCLAFQNFLQGEGKSFRRPSRNKGWLFRNKAGLFLNKGRLFLNKAGLLENNLGLLQKGILRTRINQITQMSFLPSRNGTSSCLIWRLSGSRPLLDDRSPASCRWSIIKKQVGFSLGATLFSLRGNKFAA